MGDDDVRRTGLRDGERGPVRGEGERQVLACKGFEPREG